MTIARHTRAPRPPRADRARRHAELEQVSRIRYAIPVSELIPLVERREQFATRLADARSQANTRTSALKCELVLGFYAALHRAHRAGHRGTALALEPLAQQIADATRTPCGARTLRNALTVLERAGYVELGRCGRGRVVSLPGGGCCHALVTVVTLTADAVDLWAPVRGRRSPPGVPGTGLENFSTNPKREREARRAYPRRTCVHDRDVSGATLSPVNAVRPDGRETTCPPPVPSAPSATGEHPRQQPVADAPGQKERHEGALGDFKPTGGAPVSRVISGRPCKTEPSTRQNGQRALAYDIETAVLRHAPQHHQAVMRAALRDLADPRHHLTDLALEWRRLAPGDRARLLTTTILPPLRVAARREWLERTGRADDTYQALRPWAGEPAPHVAPRSAVSRELAARAKEERMRARAGPPPDWLAALAVKHGCADLLKKGRKT